ncbi:MAG TPA: 2-hydroxyglutaryl-CoA dehydratase [Deltaproteobacteria bacterium]|nr:2-hydroxyglutaryl-CoA dehydratase [Deltaproteobacteria bacterium]
MIAAGCDVGSLTTKAVILNNTRLLGHALIGSSFNPEKSAAEVMEKALAAAHLTMDDIGFCVGTGYGRERIGFVKKTISEISCHAKGAHFLQPSMRTIIDIGGQDCKAIRLDEKGEIVKFMTNDKCASGTGRFLEVMAKLLGLELEELGRISGQTTQPINLAATCTVWAQAEVIMHLNDGMSKADLAAGINEAMAARIAILARSVGIEKDVCMTGGVAKNTGVIQAMEKQLGIPMRRLRVDPQMMGALGAAVFARERMGGR